MQQDLVLYLYGELQDGGREAVEKHVSACRPCDEHLEGFRGTLDLIDVSGLREAATLEEPVSWTDLRARMLAAPHAGGLPAPGRMLKAAAVVLLAGAAFLLGRNWDAVAPGASFGPGPAGLPSEARRAVPSSPGPSGSVAAPQDAVWRLRVFSEQTNGYLNRTRLVLLEVTNADAGPHSEVLRRASRGLLQESRHARQVAETIDDPTLADLVGRLRGILEEIARVSEQGDTSSLDRVRTHVNESGVLFELEILSTAAESQAVTRART